MHKAALYRQENFLTMMAATDSMCRSLCLKYGAGYSHAALLGSQVALSNLTTFWCTMNQQELYSAVSASGLCIKIRVPYLSLQSFYGKKLVLRLFWKTSITFEGRVMAYKVRLSWHKHILCPLSKDFSVFELDT